MKALLDNFGVEVKEIKFTTHPGGVSELRITALKNGAPMEYKARWAEPPPWHTLTLYVGNGLKVFERETV